MFLPKSQTRTLPCLFQLLVCKRVGLSVCVSEHVCKYEQLQARTHCSRHIQLCFTLGLLPVCCIGQTTGTSCLCGRCFAHWAVSPAQRLFLNKVTFGVTTGRVFGKVNVGHCSRQGYQGHHWGNDFPRSQNEKITRIVIWTQVFCLSCAFNLFFFFLNQKKIRLLSCCSVICFVGNEVWALLP